MDSKTAEKLSNVHPKLRELVTLLIANLAALGLEFRVTDGNRTANEQNALYAKGRRGVAGERTVTNARAFQSNHNFGLAVDICKFAGGKPDYNDAKAFQTLAREAKKIGLEWGGDWRAVDMPHVQLKGLSIKQCAELYSGGGLQKVWATMDRILSGEPTKYSVVYFTPSGDDLLELNDRGEQVLKLQQKLVVLNYLRPHEADGIFGKITKNAVIGFQRQNNLTADGIVGQGTKLKLGI